MSLINESPTLEEETATARALRRWFKREEEKP
jgi:hypothetical protein